jgi:hypothetical protein
MTYYLIFHTIHDVLKAEKTLKRLGFDFELVPVPRTISSDCGSCVKVRENVEGVRRCLSHIDIRKCFSFDGKRFEEM